MLKRSAALFVMVLSGLFLGSSADLQAEETVLVLQEGLDGYAGCVDTTLDGFSKTKNYGGSAYLRTWRGSDPSVPRINRHSLLKYDLSSVPTDKYIVSARLEVYCYALNYASADPKVAVKMIAGDWVEGDGNGSEAKPGLPGTSMITSITTSAVRTTGQFKAGILIIRCLMLDLLGLDSGPVWT